MRVLVVGAGYAGTHAALAARRRGADVTVVDATGNHEFGPRLAAVAGGRSPTGDGWAPVDTLTGIPVERAVVTAVDGAGPSVRLEDGRTLHADAVVVATGARAQKPDVPGVSEYAHGLRSVADALAIRRDLVEADRLVIVGGGPTGVQLAAEAAARHRHLLVTIVEATDRLLPEEHPKLGVRAEQLLRRRGVDVRRRTPVVEVTRSGVTLEGRATIDGLVVWATGWAAEGSALLPGADTVGGRLVVDQTLRIPGAYGVFAAGDVAAHRDLFGQPLAMSAQTAVRAGAVAGRNAARYVKGLPGSPALLVDIGRLVTLGRHIGVGTVGPIPLAAPVLDRFVPLLHDLVDAQYILKTGGLSGLLAHGQGRHRPRRAEMRRAERPEIRSVS